MKITSIFAISFVASVASAHSSFTPPISKRHALIAGRSAPLLQKRQDTACETGYTACPEADTCCPDGLACTSDGYCNSPSSAKCEEETTTCGGGTNLKCCNKGYICSEKAVCEIDPDTLKPTPTPSGDAASASSTASASTEAEDSGDSTTVSSGKKKKKAKASVKTGTSGSAPRVIAVSPAFLAAVGAVFIAVA